MTRSPWLFAPALALILMGSSRTALAAHPSPTAPPVASRPPVEAPTAASSEAPPTARKDDSAELAGWTAAGALEAAPSCSVDDPRVAPLQGVRMLLHAPRLLVRPAVTCGTEHVTVPLAADQDLLQRVETPVPALRWNVAIHARAGASGLVLAFVDVPPLKLEQPVDPDIPQPQAENDITPRMSEPVRWRQANLRTGGFAPTLQPKDPPVDPDVSATPATAVAEDGLLATVDGQAWVRIAKGPSPEARRDYRVEQAEVFALPGRIVVAPRPIHPEAHLELFAVDPATGVLTSLGRPAPRAAPWQVWLADVRERSGGLEALILVGDRPKAPNPEPLWGALLRRPVAGGEWTEVDRFPVASDSALRFDAEVPTRLRLDVPAHGPGRRLARPVVP